MAIKKILVVDESVPDRMNIKNIILDAGYSVIEVKMTTAPICLIH